MSRPKTPKTPPTSATFHGLKRRQTVLDEALVLAAERATPLKDLLISITAARQVCGFFWLEVEGDLKQRTNGTFLGCLGWFFERKTSLGFYFGGFWLVSFQIWGWLLLLLLLLFHFNAFHEEICTTCLMNLCMCFLLLMTLEHMSLIYVD